MTRAPSIKRSRVQGAVPELIGRIYDAALDETLWPALGPAIARTFDSPSTALRLRNLRTGEAPLLAWTDNMMPSPEAMEQYRLYYWWRDIFSQRGVQMGMSRVYLSPELVSDHELERSEFHADWLSKVDVFYLVGAVIPVDDGVVCSLGVHRPRSGGVHDENQRRALSAIVPHLSRALQIRSRLAGQAIERAATLEALERTGTATLVVAGGGRLLYANPQAEALLRQGDGIAAPGGRLLTWDQADGNRLAQAIENAIGVAAHGSGTPGAALAIQRGDRLPLTALVAPFRPARDGQGAASPAAIVFVREPENRTPSRLALQGLFGLTATEAAIAAALAEGMSADTIAALHRISLNTVRSHLKSVMAKTGTGRQAELVALILQSIASLGSR